MHPAGTGGLEVLDTEYIRKTIISSGGITLHRTTHWHPWCHRALTSLCSSDGRPLKQEWSFTNHSIAILRWYELTSCSRAFSWRGRESKHSVSCKGSGKVLHTPAECVSSIDCDGNGGHGGRQHGCETTEETASKSARGFQFDPPSKSAKWWRCRCWKVSLFQQ